MTKISKKLFMISFALFLVFLIPIVTSSIYFSLLGSGQTDHLSEVPVGFVLGDDTSSIGGTISLNTTTFLCDELPLYASVGVWVDEAVNISNSGGATYNIDLQLSTENFTDVIKNISVWVVEEDSTKHLAIEIGDDGVASTSSSGNIAMADSKEWTVEMYLETDDDVVGSMEFLFTWQLLVALA